MLRRMAKFLIPALACIGLWATVSWASVNVYAEGAYTDNDLVVYLYVDVATDPIVSYGVKLTYDPSNLGSPVVQKNSEDWYFGEQASPLATPNAEPDTSTPGEVVIVGGKLDSAAPQAGVAGDRVLLAKVTFSRLTANVPRAELYLGKDGNYSNFVQVNGDELDDILAGAGKTDRIGSVSIFARGDANGDGNLDALDYRILKQLIGTEGWPVYADGNGDGDLDALDYRWLKQNI